MKKNLHTLFFAVLIWIAGHLALAALYVMAGNAWMLVSDYTKNPVYPAEVDVILPENEGHVLRVHGIVKPITDPAQLPPGVRPDEIVNERGEIPAYRYGRLGAFLVDYYSWPEVVSGEVYLIGRQRGSVLLVYHNFRDSRLAWRLCTHAAALYDGHGYVVVEWMFLLCSIAIAALALAAVNACISSIIKVQRGDKWRWDSWRYLMICLWPSMILLPLFYLLAMGLCERRITPENTHVSQVLFGLLFLTFVVGNVAYFCHRSRIKEQKNLVNNS